MQTARFRPDGARTIGSTGATGIISNCYGDTPEYCCVAITGPVSKVMTIKTGSDDKVANMRAFAARALALLVEVARRAGYG
jgi:nicotinamide-nucleotide amidase